MFLKEDKDIEIGENYVKSKKLIWIIFLKEKKKIYFFSRNLLSGYYMWDCRWYILI